MYDGLISCCTPSMLLQYSSRLKLLRSWLLVTVRLIGLFALVKTIFQLMCWRSLPCSFCKDMPGLRDLIGFEESCHSFEMLAYVISLLGQGETGFLREGCRACSCYEPYAMLSLASDTVQ